MNDEARFVVVMLLSVCVGAGWSWMFESGNSSLVSIPAVEPIMVEIMEPIMVESGRYERGMAVVEMGSHWGGDTNMRFTFSMKVKLNDTVEIYDPDGQMIFSKSVRTMKMEVARGFYLPPQETQVLDNGTIRIPLGNGSYVSTITEWAKYRQPLVDNFIANSNYTTSAIPLHKQGIHQIILRDIQGEITYETKFIAK